MAKTIRKITTSITHPPKHNNVQWHLWPPKYRKISCTFRFRSRIERCHMGWLNKWKFNRSSERYSKFWCSGDWYLVDCWADQILKSWRSCHCADIDWEESVHIWWVQIQWPKDLIDHAISIRPYKNNRPLLHKRYPRDPKSLRPSNPPLDHHPLPSRYLQNLQTSALEPQIQQSRPHL